MRARVDWAASRRAGRPGARHWTRRAPCDDGAMRLAVALRARRWRHGAGGRRARARGPTPGGGLRTRPRRHGRQPPPATSRPRPPPPPAPTPDRRRRPRPAARRAAVADAGARTGAPPPPLVLTERTARRSRRRPSRSTEDLVLGRGRRRRRDSRDHPACRLRLERDGHPRPPLREHACVLICLRRGVRGRAGALARLLGAGVVHRADAAVGDGDADHNVANIRSRSPRGTTQMRTLTYHGRRDRSIRASRRRCRSGSPATRPATSISRSTPSTAAGCSSATERRRKEIKRQLSPTPTVSLAARLDLQHRRRRRPRRARGRRVARLRSGQPAEHRGRVTTCTSTQTCQVDCAPPMNAAPRNECIAGGTGAAGTTCNSNADCMPGTQCFNYSNIGCAVKVCLRFCNAHADCAAFGAGGGGPGSVCEGPVMCPTFLTAYHTCTFNCDPRAMAAATRGGCPTGLACVMPAAMDQVDCACPEATRTKQRGRGVHVRGRLRARLHLQPDDRHKAAARSAAATPTPPAPAPPPATTARPPARPAARSRTTRSTASASEARETG